MLKAVIAGLGLGCMEAAIPGRDIRYALKPWSFKVVDVRVLDGTTLEIRTLASLNVD